MPFISIPWIHTADPDNIWRPKPVFTRTDPFKLVMGVRTSSDVIEAGLTFRASFILFTYMAPWYSPNRIPGPFGGTEFHTPINVTSVPWNAEPARFRWGTDFALSMRWNRYFDAVPAGRYTYEGFTVEYGDYGIFTLKGTIELQQSDLFAYSSEFWFRVRFS